MSKDTEKQELDQGEALCEACGNIKVLEDGKYICPHCDVKIDFFGEDDEDDI